MESLAFGMTYAISAAAAAFGAGMVGMAAMNAAGRNLMILGIAFIDALAIIGFVVAILVKVL